VRRFVLNYSSAWAEETARYAFIYLGWLGAAYAVRERAHIRFDILFGAIPKRLHGWLYLFGELMTLAFACIALYYSMHTIRQLLEFGGATPVLRVNKVWFEAAVPLGFALVVVRSIQAMRRDLADLDPRRRAADRVERRIGLATAQRPRGQNEKRPRRDQDHGNPDDARNPGDARRGHGAPV